MSIQEKLKSCQRLTLKLAPSTGVEVEIGGVILTALKDNVAGTAAFSGSAYEKEYEQSILVDVDDLGGVEPYAGMELSVGGKWRRILSAPVYDAAGAFVTLNVGTHAGTVGASALNFTILSPKYERNGSGDTVIEWEKVKEATGELKLTSQDDRLYEEGLGELVQWDIFISPTPGMSTRMRILSPSGIVFAVRSIVTDRPGVMTLRTTEVI